jgi:hypothetical protein
MQGYCDSALRFCFAYALSAGTSFIVSVPHGHLPSFFDMAMQEQDFVPPASTDVDGFLGARSLRRSRQRTSHLCQSKAQRQRHAK